MDSQMGLRALFALRAQDAIDAVRGAVRGLVVVTNLHFSEQTYRQHVEASEQEYSREQHQRPELIHDIGVVQDLLQHKPEGNGTARHDAEHSNRAEKVERTRKVFEQEADGHQVKEYPEGPRNSVM